MKVASLIPGPVFCLGHLLGDEISRPASSELNLDSLRSSDSRSIAGWCLPPPPTTTDRDHDRQALVRKTSHKKNPMTKTLFKEDYRAIVWGANPSAALTLREHHKAM